MQQALAERYRQYHSAGAGAAICLRPDKRFGVEVRPLRKLSNGVSIVDHAKLIFSHVTGVECKGVLLKDRTEQTTTDTRSSDRMNNQTINEFMADKVMKIHVDIWFKRSGTSGGTGFAVNDRGYVVTNHHVVCPRIIKKMTGTRKQVRDDCEGFARPTRIQVRWLDHNGTKQSARASLVGTWRDLDLAVLFVLPQGTLDAEQRLSPLSLAVEEPVPLLEVLSYGYPGEANIDQVEGSVESLVATVTDGIVSRLVGRPWTTKGPKLTVVQHTAAITNGNSGGPVIDRCGRVLGVNTLGFVSGALEHRWTVVPASINFASFAGDVGKKLDQLDIDYIAERGHCLETRPR